jgi:hypothetical protein
VPDISINGEFTQRWVELETNRNAVSLNAKNFWKIRVGRGSRNEPGAECSWSEVTSNTEVGGPDRAAETAEDALDEGLALLRHEVLDEMKELQLVLERIECAQLDRYLAQRKRQESKR